MGTSDLTKDLHAHHTPTRLPMLASLEICLLAARAARISILDGVHLDLEDERASPRPAVRAASSASTGKTLIHPKQIEPANAAFGPAPAEVAWARRIIAAYDAARAAGKGVVVVDGRLVENLHVLEARRLVALAEMIEHAKRLTLRRPSGAARRHLGRRHRAPDAGSPGASSQPKLRAAPAARPSPRPRPRPRAEVRGRAR